MKNKIFSTVIILLVLYTSAIAQSVSVSKDDFVSIVKQTNDSLPDGWTARIDTSSQNEFIIQSEIIDLHPDMTSNDPPFLIGNCEIYVLVVPRITPDSINIIREKNKVLKDQLPPQNSKDNLKNWYLKNNKTLNILDSEPTNYDNKYSYRIKCRRLPRNEKEVKKYNSIISYLNRQYTKY